MQFITDLTHKRTKLVHLHKMNFSLLINGKKASKRKNAVARPANYFPLSHHVNIWHPPGVSKVTQNLSIKIHKFTVNVTIHLGKIVKEIQRKFILNTSVIGSCLSSCVSPCKVKLLKIM